MSMIPPDADRKGPFERVATPAEAVDRLAQLYDEAAQALRGAVERFLKTGEVAVAGRPARCSAIPSCALIYEPNGPPPSSPRAYAKFSEAGVYAITVTQPADFRAYLLEQLEPLVSEYGAHIEVGVGDQEIPYPYVIESGDELTRGGADAAELARYFPIPSLATIGDETADGEFVHDHERPLALFDAPRVDYSLRRLVHYTGSDWRAMQPWVLLTNYHRYVDQFVHWGLKQLRCRPARSKRWSFRATSTIDRSLTPEEAELKAMGVAWHRFQMPAYHLVRNDGRGVTSGQHRRRAGQRQEHHRPHRGAAPPLLADGRPLRGPAAVAAHRRLRARARLSAAGQHPRRRGAADDADPGDRRGAGRPAAGGRAGDGREGRGAEAPAAHRHRRHQRRPQLGAALVEGAPAASTSRGPSRSTWNRRRSRPRASACACPTARCSASPTSRCTARSSCRARPTPSTSARSASTCRSASRRSGVLQSDRRLAALAQAQELRRAAVPVTSRIGRRCVSARSGDAAPAGASSNRSLRTRPFRRTVTDTITITGVPT